MNAALELSRAEAAAMAYRARFGAPNGGSSSPLARAAAMLDRVGHVQIDTISVVERAHHHAFWAADRDYVPGLLPALEAEPRRAFEYWAHAAAYLPLSDYRFCLPRMRRIAETGHEWFPTERSVVDGVLERIRAEGPLRASDFQGGEGPRGPWWDWKPAKAALEYLFMSGRLLVRARPGFQKLYDLADRVLPDGLDTRYPSDEELGDWYVDRAARAYGVFWASDVAYLRKDGRETVAGALARAAESARLRPARVEGEKRPAWVSAEALESAGAVHGEDRPVRVLSPFDPYLIDRKRARRLLGLEYTLECYVEEAKREFGYFALPLLYRGLPAGRLDCVAQRKERRLLVKRAELLPPSEPPGAREAFRAALHEELAAFATFNGCDELSGFDSEDKIYR